MSDKDKQKEEGTTLDIDFEKSGGIIPVIVQDAASKEILIVAYANEEALIQSIKTGKATFWSRSRGKLWVKGESSGNFLKISNILIDCDQDSLIYIVDRGSSRGCHTVDQSTGESRLSCFYRELDIDKMKLRYRKLSL